MVKRSKKKKRLFAARDGFGAGLVAAARRNKNIVVLSADLTESTRVEAFRDTYPDRFFEVGVAEQNLVTLASGFAAAGKVPFAASYAVFSPGRNWEQIRTTICYNNQPVILVGSHAGLTVGADGATHQALEDIALMRVLPNMTVIYPCDALEAAKATLALTRYGKPAYLRLAREVSAQLTKPSSTFNIGKASIMRRGTDVTIAGAGPVLGLALEAEKILRAKGITCDILNFHTIKPLDVRTLVASVRKTRCLVTLDEHQKAGGLGSALVEALAQTLPVPTEIIAVDDSFGESGNPEALWKKHGLTVENVIKSVKKVMKRKQP